MSTSAKILITEFPSIMVYKHWDGYEEATLPWLREFTAFFLNNRGADQCYFVAQLLRSSARDAAKYNLDDSKFTGWGIIPAIEQVGADYTYEISLEAATITINNKTVIYLNKTRLNNQSEINKLLEEKKELDALHDQLITLKRDLSRSIGNGLSLKQSMQLSNILFTEPLYIIAVKKVSKSKKLEKFAAQLDQTTLEEKRIYFKIKRIEENLEKLGFFSDCK